MILKRFLLLFCAGLLLASPAAAVQNLRPRPTPESRLANTDSLRPEMEEMERRMQKKLQTLPADDKRRCMIRSWLGAMRFASGDYDKAAAYLNEEVRECESRLPPLQRVLLHNHLGDCYYADNDFARASKEYSLALELSSKAPGADSVLLWGLHEDLGGCYFRMKNYAAAEKEFLRVAEIQQTDPAPDKVSQGWTYLMLSDVYRKSGDKEKFDAASRKYVDIFRSVTRFDLVAERRRSSRGHARDLWAKLDRCNHDLPLISWVAPDPKGLILCIHGLGLHNGSFAPFGRQMRQRGWNVYALDVRGFGSWTQSRGLEKMDFDQCIEDVNMIVTALHELNPGLPIFLLGESMGGAIALHVAAKYPQLLTGVISSVPAGDRQGETGMELRVAFNFLFDRDRNLDIGDDLSNRVTEKEALRKRWESDPRARLSISSAELVSFNFFMKKNDKIAAQVKTPTLITQGARDALVKPAGTIDLYNKLGAVDKDLLVIGQAEHLIFEAGQFSELLLNGVTAWLDSHIKPPSASPSKAAMEQ
jgi:acylglycerol lipase